MISILAVKRDFAKLLSMKREINVYFAVNRDFHDDCYFVNCERTGSFSVKRDLDPPLYHPLDSAVRFAARRQKAARHFSCLMNRKL